MKIIVDLGKESLIGKKKKIKDWRKKGANCCLELARWGGPAAWCMSPYQKLPRGEGPSAGTQLVCPIRANKASVASAQLHTVW